MSSVFISYRHDDDAGGHQSRRVGDLTVELRKAGVNVIVDKDKSSGGPDEGWTKWSQQQVEQCDKVLIACCAGWKESYEANTPPTAGLGVAAEAHVIRQILGINGFINPKFRIVLFEEAQKATIPISLHDYHHFQLNRPDGKEQLLAWLGATPQPNSAPVWPQLPTPLNWRVANCEAEQRAFAQLLQGQSPQRALLIRGPSGRGKSLLIAEARRLARSVGVQTIYVDFKGSMGLEHLFSSLAVNLEAYFAPPAGEALPQQRTRLRRGLKSLRQPVLLLLDTLEQATDEVLHWLENDLLAQLGDYPALGAVVCGQRLPEESRAIWRDDALEFTLGAIASPQKWRDFCGRRWPGRSIPGEFIDGLVFALGGEQVQMASVLEGYAEKLATQGSAT